jgi:hypothetical protein
VGVQRLIIWKKKQGIAGKDLTHIKKSKFVKLILFSSIPDGNTKVGCGRLSQFR